MTDYEILELASLTSNEPTDAEMIDFARAIAAKEREACAREIEQYCGAWDDKGQALVQMIRARGEQE